MSLQLSQDPLMAESDADWDARQAPSTSSQLRRATLLKWAERVRRVRADWSSEQDVVDAEEHWRRRPWIIVNFFSGARRDGDFGDMLTIF